MTFYNKFDELKVTRFYYDTYCLSIIGTDTLVDSFARHTQKADDRILDFLARGGNKAMFLSNEEMEALRHFNLNRHNTDVWKKLTQEKQMFPDSVSIIEDDFDAALTGEVFFCLYTHKRPYCFGCLEKTENGYYIRNKDYMDEPGNLGYDTLSHLFMKSLFKSSSCHQFEAYETWIYVSGQPVRGPHFSKAESSCINEGIDYNRSWFYFIDLKSEMKARAAYSFDILEHFEILSRNDHGDIYHRNIYNKTTLCSYKYNVEKGQWVKLSKHCILPSEETFFAESDRLMHLHKKDILRLKKIGPVKTRQLLKDFDYFDEQ